MTLDPQHVKDAADIYVQEHGVNRAIEMLQARLCTRDEQEKNAVLEAIGYIRRHYADGNGLAEVEAAR